MRSKIVDRVIKEYTFKKKKTYTSNERGFLLWCSCLLNIFPLEPPPPPAPLFRLSRWALLVPLVQKQSASNSECGLNLTSASPSCFPRSGQTSKLLISEHSSSLFCLSFAVSAIQCNQETSAHALAASKPQQSL